MVGVACDQEGRSRRERRCEVDEEKRGSYRRRGQGGKKKERTEKYNGGRIRDKNANQMHFSISQKLKMENNKTKLRFSNNENVK